jgi:hypothetical protein
MSSTIVERAVQCQQALYEYYTVVLEGTKDPVGASLGHDGYGWWLSVLANRKRAYPAHYCRKSSRSSCSDVKVHLVLRIASPFLLPSKIRTFLLE